MFFTFDLPDIFADTNNRFQWIPRIGTSIINSAKIYIGGQLIEELFRLAAIYKSCIICVLHTTPSGMKLRGHLGSEMQRKAAGILSIEKDENSANSVVKALKVRDGSPLDVPLVQFGWNKEAGKHIFQGTKSKEETNQRKLTELQSMANELFAKKVSMNYTELMHAIMGYLSIKERMARNHIKTMNELGIIEKSIHNDNEFTLKGLPF